MTQLSYALSTILPECPAVKITDDSQNMRSLIIDKVQRLGSTWFNVTGRMLEFHFLVPRKEFKLTWNFDILLVTLNRPWGYYEDECFKGERLSRRVVQSWCTQYLKVHSYKYTHRLLF